MIKTLTIILNNSCNLNCPHCYVIQKETHLDNNYIFNKIEEEKPQIIQLFGGEPFLNQNLEQIIEIQKYCKEHNIITTATSNLTFPLSDKIISIIDNLYGLATSYNVRRWKTLEQKELWKNNCKEILKRKILWCLLTLDKDLINSKPEDIFKEINEIGFTKVRFEPYVGTVLKPDNKDIDNWLCRYYDIDKDNYLFDEIRKKLQGKDSEDLFNSNCHLHTKVLHPNGKITCCPLSNVDIRNNDSEILNKRVVKDYCNGCKWFDICQGVCPLLKEDNTGCCGYPDLYQRIKDEQIQSS